MMIVLLSPPWGGFSNYHHHHLDKAPLSLNDHLFSNFHPKLSFHNFFVVLLEFLPVIVRSIFALKTSIFPLLLEVSNEL